MWRQKRLLYRFNGYFKAARSKHRVAILPGHCQMMTRGRGTRRRLRRSPPPPRASSSSDCRCPPVLCYSTHAPASFIYFKLLLWENRSEKHRFLHVFASSYMFLHILCTESCRPIFLVCFNTILHERILYFQ